MPKDKQHWSELVGFVTEKISSFNPLTTEKKGSPVLRNWMMYPTWPPNRNLMGFSNFWLSCMSSFLGLSLNILENNWFLLFCKHSWDLIRDLNSALSTKATGLWLSSVLSCSFTLNLCVLHFTKELEMKVFSWQKITRYVTQLFVNWVLALWMILLTCGGVVWGGSCSPDCVL